jgi:Ni,Fe-hydrogenase III component G
MSLQQADKELLDKKIQAETGLEPIWTQDSYSNYYGVIYLTSPEQIKKTAEVLAGCEARLATITAFAAERTDPVYSKTMAYHFLLHGVMFTVNAPLYDKSNKEEPKALSIPSITPWFFNASWPERECREMFNIDITEHPDLRRLFLDERLEAGVMTKLLPFSALVNGTTSSGLWEDVMSSKEAQKAAEKAVQAVNDATAAKEAADAAAAKAEEVKAAEEARVKAEEEAKAVAEAKAAEEAKTEAEAQAAAEAAAVLAEKTAKNTTHADAAKKAPGVTAKISVSHKPAKAKHKSKSTGKQEQV